MTAESFPVEPAPLPPSRPQARPRVVLTTAVCGLLFAAILAASLTWAKWWPYSHKLATMLGTHAFSGHSVLAAAGKPGQAPSWHDAWSFAVTYGKSIWIALVAGLLVGAGVESLLPRQRLVATLRGRRTHGSAAVGGLLSLPCMMCTCCSAPIVVSLRRSGAPVPSALAYWLGNPTLNPAVMAFLVLVLPWQYAATRILIGLVLVFGLTTLVSRLAPGAARIGDNAGGPAPVPEAEPLALRRVPGNYLRALARLAVVLVPEYALVVLTVGALRGWLLPLGHDALSWGIGAALVAAVAGTLLVIPTAGEIPIIAGLAAAGFGAGVTGTLLIALPALSLPSMVMVGRALSWRVTAAMAAAVALAALAGGAVLAALGG